ncbi:hypothetical protein E2320_013107 [Naja naja]|nr:hypothetical protein E2320_013107 [Naja naja]
MALPARPPGRISEAEMALYYQLLRSAARAEVLAGAGGRGKGKEWIPTQTRKQIYSHPGQKTSFPGNLHLVMVLRPTGFFQRTFTDIGFRFSQEDFLLKLPVVMLSSVSELLTYIDEKQLTPEFGGTLEYCHSEWEDITAVTKEGKMLLCSLEEPDMEGLEEDKQQERSSDWETVNRLLTQLHEMERAFDGFWEKHQLKMEQYLQLWKFEQNFQELSKALEFLTTQQRELLDTGENLSQVKQRISELDNLEQTAQDLTAKAHVVILHGHQMAASHHYALNLICQQCNELRHHSDILLEEIKRKHNRLQQTSDLLTSLQQALECCDEGVYLLANQPLDKCQSREGAQKALQDIEKFLESSSLHLNIDPQALSSNFHLILTPELKARVQMVQIKLENVRSMFENRQACFRKLADKQVRPVQLVAPRPECPARSKSPLFSPKHVVHNYQEKRNSLQYYITESEDSLDMLKSHVIHELIQTERVYVEELFTVLMGYRAEMDNPTMAFLLPPLLRSCKDVLFGNMPEIYDFHNNGRIFRCMRSTVRISHSQNLSGGSTPRECQKKLEHKLSLDSYLLKPVQRLTKYQLLLKELLKYSTSCEGVQELQEALVAMLDLVKSVNDSMHQISITGYDGDLGELGKVLMQGSFSVWVGHRKGPTKMKDLARFKPMQRHLFLYEKALVFCKKREEHCDSYDKRSSYSFKHFLKMNAVGITENVKGDPRKFEIWYSGREEVYVVQAQTFDLKMAWLNEIRKILFKQQQLIKDEKQVSPLCTDTIQLSPPLSDGSEENDSERTSPIAVENLASSSQSKPSKPWTGMSHSLEICEGLEEWSSHHYFSTCSDTEEEDGNQLSPGKYKALADCKKRDSDELLVKNGDVIQLLHEDGEGQWLVKNLTRSKEGWVPTKSLQIILGDCRFRSTRVTGIPEFGDLGTALLSCLEET